MCFGLHPELPRSPWTWLKCRVISFGGFYGLPECTAYSRQVRGKFDMDFRNVLCTSGGYLEGILWTCVMYRLRSYTACMRGRIYIFVCKSRGHRNNGHQHRKHNRRKHQIVKKDTWKEKTCAQHWPLRSIPLRPTRLLDTRGATSGLRWTRIRGRDEHLASLYARY
jgi:hypothetical protein